VRVQGLVWEWAMVSAQEGLVRIVLVVCWSWFRPLRRLRARKPPTPRSPHVRKVFRKTCFRPFDHPVKKRAPHCRAALVALDDESSP
jgi:hypothetical protein